MKFFQFKTIRSKLIAVALLILTIPILILGTFSYTTSKKALEQSGIKRLESNVELTLEMMEQLNNEVEKGNISLEEAQEMVKVSILGEKQPDGTRPINPLIDLGEHGYMFINDSKGNLQAHPTIEGENTWDREDVNGNYYAQEYIKAGLDGGGITYYPYPLPNDQDRIEEKVTYSKAFPAWDWVVIASTYMIDFNSEAKHILQAIMYVIGATLVIGIIIIWIFSSRMANTLQLMTNRMGRIAEGDLSEEPLEVKTKDEFGHLATAVNQMQTGLTTIVQRLTTATETISSRSEELNQAAYEVSKGTEQMTATMEELASGAEAQAHDTEEASGVMNNFVSLIEETNENGDHIRSHSDNVLQMTAHGQELMTTSTKQMQTIDEIVQDAVSKVEGLDEHSQAISELVSVIHDISEQTNLIALNAAIEAARAGEHGQGFSVVADEVRKLAEEASNSVTDITEIVARIQNEASTVAESLRDGYKEVEQGTTHINTTEETFSKISEAVSEMADNIANMSTNLATVVENSSDMSNSIENIAAVSEEAAAGIEESTAAIEQANASMQEVSGSSDELAHLAEDLQALVEQFKLK
ncbi:MAG TPA: methyl-accepting chemotaxis protein [Pseudogracilibacillus sp.]|nr:methyl-accepting chemotaxis protein [Pseudogracilibacillus sp.]